MVSILWYALAALGEIGGCFAFWAVIRLGKNPLWFVPGAVALVVFALALTQVEASNAGRAFAAYGGIYILASLLWLWGVEGVKPDRWDALGAVICVIGATLILFGPRSNDFNL